MASSTLCYLVLLVCVYLAVAIPVSLDPPSNSTNLVYPYGGWAMKGADGLPDVNTTNNAEACPSSHKFKCKHDGDVESVKCDQAPGCCRNVYGCHPYLGHPSFHGEAGNITVTQLLQRAAGWVVNTFKYHDQNNIETCAANDTSGCPHHGWISDCIGFVHMAWHTDFGSAEDGNPNIPIEKRINNIVLRAETGQHPFMSAVPCNDAQPGDWVSSGAHARIFRRWNGPADSDGSRPWLIWQMGGGFGACNYAHGRWVPEKGYKCLRRGNLINDTAVEDMA